MARHGVDISRSTLCGWMAAAADLLRPLYRCDARRRAALARGPDRRDAPAGAGKRQRQDQVGPVVDDSSAIAIIRTPSTSTRATKARTGRRTNPQGLQGFPAGRRRQCLRRLLPSRRHLRGGLLGACAAILSRCANQRCRPCRRGARAHRLLLRRRTQSHQTIDKEKFEGEQADALRCEDASGVDAAEAEGVRGWLTSRRSWCCPRARSPKPSTMSGQSLAGIVAVHGVRLLEHRQQRLGACHASGGAGTQRTGCSPAVTRAAAPQRCFTRSRKPAASHGIDPFAYLQDVLTRLPKGDFQELADLFPIAGRNLSEPQLKTPLKRFALRR